MRSQMKEEVKGSNYQIIVNFSGSFAEKWHSLDFSDVDII